MDNRRYKNVGLALAAFHSDVQLSRNALVMATPAPAPDFRALLGMPISWSNTTDLDTPWRASLGGLNLAVRMNDFPDETLYSLLVDDKVVAEFDDWPPAWSRA